MSASRLQRQGRSNPLDGWQADVEVSGEGWRADVLAVRGSIKIAIEIQVSAQAKRETILRNDRFELSGVSVFWIKGKRNYWNDFGDRLQAPVQGASIREQMSSVRSAVRDMLEAVERQVQMANHLARLIRTMQGWAYKIEMQGSIPAYFELHREGKRQQIPLGELGPSLLPTIFRPVDRKQIGADQFAGAILQIRVNAPHLRGYKSSSFRLARHDIFGSLERQLRPILEGRVAWQGQEHTEVVPGTFVHYAEECSACATRFLRITHLLLGHPEHPEAFSLKVVSDDWSWYEPIMSEAETLSKAVELPLGPLLRTLDTQSFSTARSQQICPTCGRRASPPLISGDEALRFWPGRHDHFHYRLRLPGRGWSALTAWQKRPSVDAAAWHALLERRRFERQQERRAAT